jgi:hypothetical protein
MKRLIALVTGTALVATGMTVAATSSSSADTAAVVDDWSMSVAVPNTTWEEQFQLNFTPCNDLVIRISVEAELGTPWTISGTVGPVGGASPIESFGPINGFGPANEFRVPGIQMCEHFNVPSAPADGRYVVTGTATVPSGTPTSRTFAVEFTIAPMPSYVMLLAHEVQANASLFRVRVSQNSSGIMRPVSGGSLILEKLEGSSWIKAGDGVLTSDGVFTVSAGSILPTGAYIRFRYLGDYSVAPSSGPPHQVFPPTIIPTPTPPAAQPIPKVKVTAVSSRSKLKVDVNPNMGSKYWTFQVQRRNTDGSWKALKTYRTWGSTERRTVNLRKGTYRVWVNPKFGYQGAMSPNEVTLKR